MGGTPMPHFIPKQIKATNSYFKVLDLENQKA
jgi:hypothetical protein